MKKCRKCGEVLPIESFSRNRASKDGRTNYCKRCDSIRKRRPKKKRGEYARYSDMSVSREPAVMVDGIMAFANNTVKTHEPYYKARRDAEVVAWEV